MFVVVQILSTRQSWIQTKKQHLGPKFFTRHRDRIFFQHQNKRETVILDLTKEYNNILVCKMEKVLTQ